MPRGETEHQHRYGNVNIDIFGRLFRVGEQRGETVGSRPISEVVVVVLVRMLPSLLHTYKTTDVRSVRQSTIEFCIVKS